MDLTTTLAALLLLFLSDGVSRAEGGERNEVVVQRVDVPRVVGQGEDVELECHYEISGNLYSIKWYLDDREFFRYQPYEDTSIMIFERPGLNVNREMSEGRRVKLNNVQHGASGMYKCEVIGEGPEFLTSDKHARMMVVNIPEEKPTIFGTKHEYKIGDTARLTCVSAPSRPPAMLTWFINDKKAPMKYLIPLEGSRSLDAMEESRLGLEFRVGQQHFHKGQMNLRCSAEISTLYYKTQQHSIDGHLTYNVPVMESREHSATAGGSMVQVFSLMVLLTLAEVVLMHLAHS